MTGDGGQVYHVAAVLFPHCGQHRRNAVHHTFDVYIHHLVPLVYLERIQRCQWHQAGIIDQDIDPAKSFFCRGGESFHLFAVGYIGDLPDDFGALGTQVLRQGFQAVFTACC